MVASTPGPALSPPPLLSLRPPLLPRPVRVSAWRRGAPLQWSRLFFCFFGGSRMGVSRPVRVGPMAPRTPALRA